MRARSSPGRQSDEVRLTTSAAVSPETAVKANLQVEMRIEISRSVVPAKAVTHIRGLLRLDKSIPAFAGMTLGGCSRRLSPRR